MVWFEAAPTSTTCTFDSPVTNQEAIRDCFRATLDSTGNLPSLAGPCPAHKFCDTRMSRNDRPQRRAIKTPRYVRRLT